MKAPTQTYAGGGRRIDLDAIVDFIKKFQAFFWLAGILAGGTVGIINYFATREQLERLDCDRSVNEYMLKAHGNAFNARQLSDAENDKLYNEQQELEKITQNGGANDIANIQIIRALQLQIEESKKAIQSYDANAASEAHAEQVALSILVGQKGCDTKDHRESTDKILNPSR